MILKILFNEEDKESKYSYNTYSSRNILQTDKKNEIYININTNINYDKKSFITNNKLLNDSFSQFSNRKNINNNFYNINNYPKKNDNFSEHIKLPLKDKITSNSENISNIDIISCKTNSKLNYKI